VVIESNLHRPITNWDVNEGTEMKKWQTNEWNVIVSQILRDGETMDQFLTLPCAGPISFASQCQAYNRHEHERFYTVCRVTRHEVIYPRFAVAKLLHVGWTKTQIIDNIMKLNCRIQPLEHYHRNIYFSVEGASRWTNDHRYKTNS
jgi:hypothetical protein